MYGDVASPRVGTDMLYPREVFKFIFLYAVLDTVILYYSVVEDSRRQCSYYKLHLEDNKITYNNLTAMHCLARD